jgi:hypothetical protein
MGARGQNRAELRDPCPRGKETPTTAPDAIDPRNLIEPTETRADSVNESAPQRIDVLIAI